MNDDFLNRFRQPPPPKFAADLYQRISKPMYTPQPIFTRQRVGYAFASLLVLFTLTFTVSPSARAYAADVLHQIGLLTFSSRPVGEPVVIAPPTADQIASASATATPIVPPDQAATPLDIAQARAGFAPYLPTYLPEGYQAAEINALEYIDDWYVGYGMGIFATYLAPNGGYLAIQTTRFDQQRAQDIPLGDYPTAEVMVNGQTGVWIEGLPLTSSHTASTTINMLVWNENGMMLAIQTDRLPLEEVLAIAASLRQ